MRLYKSKMNKVEVISCKDFDDIFYKFIVAYVMRNTKYVGQNLYQYTSIQIYRTFELLQLIHDDLSDYYDTEKSAKEEVDFYKINYKEFEKICKKYINICREEINRFAGWTICDLLTSVGELFEKDSDKITFEDLESKATKKDLEYANKHFSKHHNDLTNEDYEIEFNKDNCKIIKYKGLKIYEYIPWDIGYLLDTENEIHEFPFDWDWWYLIDKYIYLEKDWKRN